MSTKKNSLKSFIKDLIERAIVTFAEAMLGFMSVGQAFGDIDWVMALSVSGVAVLVSVLKSIVASKVGDKNTASLVSTK